jgi:hypothetical protein
VTTPDCIEWNDLTGEVRLHGTNYRFRPKTFELLRLLANSPTQVFSKESILQQVWPDSIVEEQAVFQSINEIRKAFAPIEVIKTYPKKGYAWVLASGPSAAPKQPARRSFGSNRKFWGGFILLFSLGLALFGYHNWISIKETAQPTRGNGARSQAAAHQAILVLPFDVSKLNKNQHWLKFAGMDSVIQHLQPGPDLTVFQLADVIDILKRLPQSALPDSSGRMTSAAITQLFQLAGITQIIQTEITGVPGDYQLIYTLHHADSQQKSAVHSMSLEQSLPLLAQQVSASLSQKTTTNIDMQNHLLANTLELVALQKFSAALPLALSALTITPDNILVHYVLADIQLRLGQYTEALATVEQGLTLQKAAEYPQYAARLWYQKGVLLMQSGNLQHAESTLLKATQLANQQKDWLYLAYSHSMLAQLKLAQKQFEAALPLLNAALQYQQMLQCPQGIAQSELDLADYLMLVGQKEQAQHKYHSSAALVQQKNLTQLTPVLQEFAKRWQPQLIAE